MALGRILKLLTMHGGPLFLLVQAILDNKLKALGYETLQVSISHCHEYATEYCQLIILVG